MILFIENRYSKGMENYINRSKTRWQYDKVSIEIKRRKLNHLTKYVKNLYENNNFIQFKIQIKQTFTAKHVNNN